MKRNGVKILWAIFALVCAMLLCTACSGKEPQSNVTADYSGRYTDKQGTAEIYSELELRRNEDGAYSASISLYRLMLLEGTAEEMNGTLHFTSDAASGPAVEGDIAVNGETAEITITGSDTDLIAVGTVYRFPDGKET